MHARPKNPAYVQAVLLIGFSQYEVDAFRAFMIDMDADMVKVNFVPYLPCACPRESLLLAFALSRYPMLLHSVWLTPDLAYQAA